jgi:hypothetical protein
MTALEDKETQKRGIVLISYSNGAPVRGHDKIFKISKLIRSVPLRPVGLHVCVDDPKIEFIATLGALLIGSQNRARFRCHSGTDLEVQYKLMTFGIPSTLLPISTTGEMDMATHQKWLEGRRHLEQQYVSASMDTTTVQTVVVPSRYDVLLGRGKFFQEHTGNLRYRDVVENHRERYEKASKAEKTLVAKELVHIVNGYGGRFLKQGDHQGWIEVTVDTARDKVSHSFRNRRIALSGGVRNRGGATHNMNPEERSDGNGVKFDTKRPRLAEPSFSEAEKYAV